MENQIEVINSLRKSFSRDKMAMIYHGVFDDSFTEQLISLAEGDVEKKAKKRMALLISESFQNVIRHGDSDRKDDDSSLFCIRGIDQFIHIFSSNSVDLKTKLFLENKLNHINTLDKDQLKEVYKNALESGEISEKGGAGLGLIEMARKSEMPIQKRFNLQNENLFDFQMQIDLVVNDGEEISTITAPNSIDENESIHKHILENEVIFLYKGDFNSDIVTSIMNIMKDNAGYSGKPTGFRLFHAGVELMQNIVRYGKEFEGKRDGLFTLNKMGNGYYLCSGNYVTEDTQALELFITEINKKDKAELDQIYRTGLKQSVLNDSSAAGIGLIDLRRTMLTNIDIHTISETEGTYLLIGIEIPFV
jgi:hypothetical protein